jgi:hypothetical protein
MREENEFNNIVHAVCIGKSVPYSSFRGEHIEDIQGSHSIGRVLCEQMYKFRYQRCFFNGSPCIFIKGKVIVDEKGEVEKNIVVTGEESF